ncbi:S1C family serine protease [Salinispira pacifica]
MLVKLSLLCATSVLTLVACATPPPNPVGPPPPSRKVVVKQELDQLLSSSEPQTVFPRLTYYQATSTVLDRSELADYSTRGVTAVKDAFYAAVDNRDYRAAEGFLLSLQTLAQSDSLPGGVEVKDALPTNIDAGGRAWTLDQLRLLRAEAARRDGNDAVALDEFLRIGDLAGSVSTGNLETYGRIAVRFNDRTGMRRIIEALGKSGPSVPDQFSSFEKSRPTASDMLKGTVTIWVNRGIKVDSGVGYPDRVIGSGFFIDPRGYLITNYHVISSEVDPTYEGFSRLYVRLPSRPDERIPARVVGFSRIFDIALIKVEVTPGYLFSFTHIHSLDAGTKIYAMGSPGGLENTISSGIISATGRRFLQMGDAIQMDVSVNPGNSGGPLVDDRGDLVGVVFAGIEQFQGVNFAIPSFWVKKFLPQLYNGGEVNHPWLGAAVQETDNGLEVTYVSPGSPAAKAGIHEHDVITSINSKPVTKVGEAQDTLLSLPPASLLRVKWKRAGEEQEGFVVPAPRPYSPVEQALKTEAPSQLFPVLFGMEVSSTSSLPWQNDFVITHVYQGSTADETGLSVRDPLTVVGWQLDREKQVALLQIVVRKRKAGFLEKAIQLGAYIQVPNFI